MKSLSQRTKVTDQNLAQFLSSLGDKVIVGQAFVFLKREFFQHPSHSWVANLLKVKGPLRPQVLSLLSPRSVGLPGLEIQPPDPNRMSLSSITSDKAIYKAEADTVRLLVLDPIGADQPSKVIVKCNGQRFSHHPVWLGAYGQTALILKDLPVGDYEVCFESEEKDEEKRCSFTVAEYRLVPLVASITKRKFSAGSLELTLNLESYGMPVQGKVRADVMEGSSRVETLSGDCTDGIFKIDFALTGTGTHSLNLQLQADPAKTASVPIVGSRETQRSQTLFSPLGTEYFGSLLPSPDANSVRGIFLTEGGMRSAPLTLERVDSKIARLTANARLESVRIVVIDPASPRPRIDALDTKKDAHPSQTDAQYDAAKAEFDRGNFAESDAILEKLRAALSNPHPYYAYGIACGKAQQGKSEEALAWLGKAIGDGFNEFEHMADDDDLASLRSLEKFELLLNGGQRELEFEQLENGQTIEIESFEPCSLLAIGAFLKDKPWEAWASVISPSDLTCKIEVEKLCVPGEALSISFDTGDEEAAVYAVVKDARLMSLETTESNLASGIKQYVEAAAKDLQVGKADTPISKLIPAAAQFPPQAPRGPIPALMPSPSSWGSPPPPTMAYQPNQSPMRAAFADQSSAFAAAAPVYNEPMYDTLFSAAEATDSWAAQADLGAPASEAQNEPGNGSPAPLTESDPEVLFAGFVPCQDGKQTLSIQIPDTFADYLIESFAIKGRNWTSAEARFRSEKDCFVDLVVPTFARTEDKVKATVFVSSRNKPLRVKVIVDGKPFQLLHNGQDFAENETISETEISLSYLAVPGEHQAIITDEQGNTVGRVVRKVEQPGKLRRAVKFLRLLEPGQKVSLKDAPGIFALSVLPGLDSPFELLVDATADYGHACCEQTAAKIMSACAMYMFADTPERKTLAESIILAGVRREHLMYLPNRGFKMYPESSNQPHDYYSPKVAYYLGNLSLLLNGNGGTGNRDLDQGIKEALEMAAATLAAYRISWPPAHLKNSEDAYLCSRFGDEKESNEGLKFVKNLLKNGTDVFEKMPADPYCGQQVNSRVQSAYAAATLIRAGGAQERKTGITLADKVVCDFNEQGRLYSTSDSVAAIALLAELRAAKTLGGAALVKVNGTNCTVAEAQSLPDQISEIEVVEGTAVVEVAKMVEEDWSTFGTEIAMRVALQKGSSVQRSFKMGDQIDLHVKIESGYKDGDLLWVCLPDSLSRLIGGGQVKLFSVDFRGKVELSIPLVATGLTSIDSPQRLAICIRNMFDEERAGTPGLMPITITA